MQFGGDVQIGYWSATVHCLEVEHEVELVPCAGHRDLVTTQVLGLQVRGECGKRRFRGVEANLHALAGTTPGAFSYWRSTAASLRT